MSKLIRYTGDQKRTEVAITGRGKTWWPGELRMVPDAIASALLLSGGAWEIERGSDAEDELNEVTASTDPVTGAVEKIQVSGEQLPVWLAHPGCKFHGFAGSQFIDDPVFLDRSAAGNHGVFGVDLSVANAWANAGYVSTVDPATGVTDSVIRIPSIAWDLSAGESLVLFWLGKVTAEGASTCLIGDTSVNSVAGFQITLQSTGKAALWLSNGAGAWVYCGNSNTIIGSGTLVSFALIVYGDNKKYQYLSNGSIDYTPTNIPAGTPATLTANTLNIGAGTPAPGGTAGVATKTRALSVFTFSSGDQPAEADILAAFKQWRSSPDRLIVSGAI